MSPSNLPTQALGSTHEHDPTVTTLEQGDAEVTRASVLAAARARVGLGAVPEAEPEPEPTPAPEPEPEIDPAS